jgi:serine/threonine-protein kinase
MKICPQCRTSYPDGTARCPKDGVEPVDDRPKAPAAEDRLIGETVAGRFRIEERIGLGGMGAVYRATQTGLSRNVALKILKADVSLKRDAVTRFHREAKAMSLLVHPNTVRVFDFGETDDGLLYLAMELLEGEGLSDKSRREGEVDITDAIRIAQQLLSSLHEAHSKGLIHRDLKPDNIFLARVDGHSEPVVKVLDFGIAKAWQGDQKLDQYETQAGTVFGTPRYMSPEQAQGNDLDPRSDLYGVGILLYQLLTGAPPFVDDDAVLVMAKHIRDPAPPVRSVAPQRPIPRSLERVLIKALEKDRKRRFQSAEEFIMELEACLPDVAAEAQGERPSPIQQWLGGVPRAVLATAASVVLGAIAVSIYLIAAPSGRAAEPDPAHAAPPEVEPSAPRTATAPQRAVSQGNDEKRDAGAPAAQTSEIELSSQPKGASVWQGNRRVGQTPWVHTLSPGEHVEVELRKQGYETETVELVAGQQPERVELEPDRPTHDARPHAVRRQRPRRHRDHAPAQSTGDESSADPSPSAPDSSSDELRNEPYQRFD